MKCIYKIMICISVFLICTLCFLSCCQREEGDIIEAFPPADNKRSEKEVYTVTYKLEGEILSAEEVLSGCLPGKIPERYESQGIVSWKNRNGIELDIRIKPITDNTVYEAVLGPELKIEASFFPPEADGLFHPQDYFTRGDAVRCLYNIMENKPSGSIVLKDVTTRAKCYVPASAMVELGYISLKENNCFDPDAPIKPQDLIPFLSHFFSPKAVETAMPYYNDTIRRCEAADLLCMLLDLKEEKTSAYFPDVSPTSAYYSSISIAGRSDWTEKPKKGYYLRAGYLYYVGENGYFVTDKMIGTLYFDVTGRYTSGNEGLDKFVAETLKSQVYENSSLVDPLQTIYQYVRDHYLYMKRNYHEVGESGWEIEEANTMFETGKGNCYNFTAVFWALARGLGYNAVCYSGLIGTGKDPHSWVEIEFDGIPYIFDVETEMSYRLQNDYYTSMYMLTYEEGEPWSYIREINPPG